MLLAALGAIVVLQSGRWIPVARVPYRPHAILVQANVPILEGADWTQEYFSDTLHDLSTISLNAALASPPETRRSIPA